MINRFIILSLISEVGWILVTWGGGHRYVLI